MANSSYRNIQDNTLAQLNKSNDTSARTRVQNSINMGYFDFVLRETWPFREKTGTLLTVAGTQEYELITTFTDIDGQAIISVALQGSSELKLRYIAYNQLRNIAPDLDADGNAQPQYYYVKAGKIGFFPVPDSAYDVAIDYLLVPTELSADADVPVIPVAYREALMQYALSMEHDFNTDPDLAQKAMNRYEQIVNLARQNLLAQPLNEGSFIIQGPESFVTHTGLPGEIV